MKLLNVSRDIERYTAPDGSINRIFAFLRAELRRQWKWSWEKWGWDGLPRYTIHAGPIYIHCGKDHYWIDPE